MTHITQAIKALQAARAELPGHRIETMLADAEAALSRVDLTEDQKQIQALRRANSALYRLLAEKNRQIVKAGLPPREPVDLGRFETGQRTDCDHGTPYVYPCADCAHGVSP